MHIAIVTVGSRGDIQPYIAFAVGLKNAGYSTTFSAPPNFEPLARQYDLNFDPIGDDSQDIVENQLNEALTHINVFNAVSRIRTILSLYREGYKRMMADMLHACQGADLILTHFALSPFGMSIAEKTGALFVEGALMPLAPTSAFASPIFPGENPVKAFNRLSYRLTEPGYWRMLWDIVNTGRRELLGLDHLSLPKYYRRLDEAALRLYAFSPTLVARPDDWASNIHITSCWILPLSETWEPPPALTDFLEAGPPPVYIGFGSMPSQNPEQMTGIVVDALERSGQRGILLSGWGGFDGRELPETILRVDSVPHEWLFPRMAAVVHHGGAGTTAAGLRSGVPSIVIPYIGDQPFWAGRVYGLGVGPEPIPRKKLTAQKLANAIQLAVTDENIRQQARIIGEKIQKEDGIGQAIEHIENLSDQA